MENERNEIELPCTILLRQEKEVENCIQNILRKKSYLIQSSAKQGRYGFYLVYQQEKPLEKKVLITTLYKNGFSDGYWLSCGYEENFDYFTSKFSLGGHSVLFKCPKRIWAKSTNMQLNAVKWRANCMIGAMS